MCGMEINLKRFIENHYKSGVSARDVVREAVTNSVQANASLITVSLHFSESSQKSLAGMDAKMYLNSITISDDGDGFTPENLKSFEEICTDHKANLGGKGIGRLAFLKFANCVKIASQVKDELVSFDYTPEFNLGVVDRTIASGQGLTIVKISEVKDEVNTQVKGLVESICDDLRLLFFLSKLSGREIKLRFAHDSHQTFEREYEFSGDDVSGIKQKSFIFEGETFACTLFKNDHPMTGIFAMLCADSLCVETYPISKNFEECKYSIFVTSEYFNGISNMERQKLLMREEGDSGALFAEITRDKLLKKIKQECMDMIDHSSPGIMDNFKRNNLNKLRKYYPYINIDAVSEKASFLTVDEIVRDHRKSASAKEDKIVTSMERGTVVPIGDISHLAGDDLARYIVHRSLLLNSLENLPPESLEGEIHKAFAPGDDGVGQESNIWMLDDKFLSYLSVHSDKAIGAIVSGINNENLAKNGRKPDIAAFFTRDDEDKPNKLVIIEFKKINADLFENTKALSQCRYYASSLVEKIPSVMEVFSFAIMTIDDELRRDLKQTGFKSIFSPKDHIFYNDFAIGDEDNIPLHQYVMPLSAILKDAKSRNKVFEDILGMAK